MKRKYTIINDLDKLMESISDYYGVKWEVNNPIKEYISNSKQAILDLLNHFDKNGKPFKDYEVFDNVYLYKNWYRESINNYENLVEDYNKLDNKLSEYRYYVDCMQNLVNDLKDLD